MFICPFCYVLIDLFITYLVENSILFKTIPQLLKVIMLVGFFSFVYH